MPVAPSSPLAKALFVFPTLSYDSPPVTPIRQTGMGLTFSS